MIAGIELNLHKPLNSNAQAGREIIEAIWKLSKQRKRPNHLYINGGISNLATYIHVGPDPQNLLQITTLTRPLFLQAWTEKVRGLRVFNLSVCGKDILGNRNPDFPTGKLVDEAFRYHLTFGDIDAIEFYFSPTVYSPNGFKVFSDNYVQYHAAKKLFIKQLGEADFDQDPKQLEIIQQKAVLETWSGKRWAKKYGYSDIKVKETTDSDGIPVVIGYYLRPYAYSDKTLSIF